MAEYTKKPTNQRKQRVRILAIDDLAKEKQSADIIVNPSLIGEEIGDEYKGNRQSLQSTDRANVCNDR